MSPRVSAPDFRKALQTGDDISQFIPPGVDQESIRNIFIAVPVQEQKKTFTLLYSLVEEVLNEKQKKTKVSKPGQKRVSKKIAHLIGDEGKSKEQAAAIAYSMEEEGELEEISAMAAGSAEGGSGKRYEEEESLIREDDMIEQIMNYLVKSGIMEKQ